MAINSRHKGGGTRTRGQGSIGRCHVRWDLRGLAFPSDANLFFFFSCSLRHTEFALKQTSSASQTHITKDKLFKQAQGPELRKHASCAATWRTEIKVTNYKCCWFKNRKWPIKFCTAQRCWHVCIVVSTIRDDTKQFIHLSDVFGLKDDPNGAFPQWDESTFQEQQKI